MSIEDQTHKRQVQLFKQVSGFYETGAGVKVQRVAGSHVLRVLKPYIQARIAEDAAGRDPDRVNPARFLTAQSDLREVVLTTDRRLALHREASRHARPPRPSPKYSGSTAQAARAVPRLEHRPRDPAPQVRRGAHVRRLYERDDLGTSANIVKTATCRSSAHTSARRPCSSTASARFSAAQEPRWS